MLSRKAICLWSFLALPLVALVASGVSLGQDEGEPPEPEAVEAAVNAAPSQPARPAAVATPEKPGKGSEIGVLLKALNDERARAEAQLMKANAQLMKANARLNEVRASISRNVTPRPRKATTLGLRSGVRYEVRNERTREHDPQMAKLLEQDSALDKEARGLAEQCRKETDKEKRAELKARLAELTEKHFELRQERRELQIAQLETELEKVRATIDKRNDARELIIRRRVSQLLGEKDELDWGPSAASPLRTRGPTRVFQMPNR